MEKLKKKCEEEIKWAQDNIKQMEISGNPHRYQEEDKVWLPCWLKAHQDMLALIDEITDLFEIAGKREISQEIIIKIP